ncbi:SusC/RagA family TonB-linked outer membrane protein [Bacteroidia bacterium]|nr:SusC/RagA family TonB-linked outer membrane protein [Bacteroidia bacterium]
MLMKKILLKKTVYFKRTFILVNFCVLSVAGWAQNLNISGRVANADGEPVVGASVSIKGTTQGVITGINGDYDIQAPADAALVFSFLGMGSQTEAVNGRARIDITLNGSTTDLDEVVVVGYGSVRKGDLTTAVATVSTKDIDQRPITSAGQAIQGKAAGVQVMQPSGRPGADLSIRVRGATSFNGSNDPLYVVDGVPVDNINFLSPNDIESMQILKDASSAAIYGSRAANGVILISTKSGGKGTAKVTFSAQVGVDKVANRIETLNAKQYQELMNEISPGAVPDDAVNDVTDWYKEVYQTGITQNYQLSVSGGSDKLNYFLSGGYLDQQGIIQSAFFKRYSFRSNVNGQVRQWLDVGANVSYSDNRSNGIGTENNGANRSGLVMAAINAPTSRPVKDATGLYNHYWYGENMVNPVEAIENGKDDEGLQENRLIASANALITFMPGLTFKSMFTLDRRHGVNRWFSPVVHATDEYGEVRNDYGEGHDERNRNTLLVWDNVANWNKSFSKNNFNIMAGSSWTTSDYTNSYMTGTDYRNNDIKTLNAANRVSWNGSGTGAAQWAIMSYFGRVAYNFDGKYLATVNLRADGSSKLHPDHRWGVFPSFSAAWRISSEEFMSGTKSWLNDAKIRGGWGQTGNQSGVGDYGYLERYSISRQDWTVIGQERIVPIISQSSLSNPDLTWETTSQTDIGIDLTMFNNRLEVAIDYYYKHTTDMLMTVTLPQGAAATNSLVRNEGEMVNQGFEFTVNSRNLTGALQWNTQFNISLNRNRLKSLELQKIYYSGATSDAFHNTYVVRNEPGHPLSGFYGYISDGVDPETGELIYRDDNRDGRLSATDRTYIGDPNPDFIFGMTNSLSWKGLSLSIFLQGSYGNDIFNATKADIAGMRNLTNQSTLVLKRWRTPGQFTDVPKVQYDNQVSSYYVEDGSYLRIKDITLAYNVQAAFLKRIGISRLQPYITARNLFTLTNYTGMDPEVNSAATTSDNVSQGIDFGAYPQSRTWMFGVNVEF